MILKCRMFNWGQNGCSNVKKGHTIKIKDDRLSTQEDRESHIREKLCSGREGAFSESSAGPPTTSLRPEGFIAQKRRDAGSRRGKPNECQMQTKEGQE
ncbi:unnamed protein product [Lupinus luteus]|uniref:Uncharacterized protein n=1 Tax=Lupinus luteus TaxID=3873 RepID=A0AAV1XU08_LUPLU